MEAKNYFAAILNLLVRKGTITQEEMDSVIKLGEAFEKKEQDMGVVADLHSQLEETLSKNVVE